MCIEAVLSLCFIQVLSSFLNSSFVMTPLFVKANSADRMEMPETSVNVRNVPPHRLHRILGDRMPRVSRICFRSSVMRAQKPASSSQDIASDQDAFSFSSISGNQTRWASPAGIRSSPPHDVQLK
jgi:hypothetical protein